MRRVDLDDLRAKAEACSGKATARVLSEPWYRPRLYDVLTEKGGVKVYEGATQADAQYAVASQPAVAIALLDRIAVLEVALNDAMIALGSHSLPAAANAARQALEQGVVLE